MSTVETRTVIGENDLENPHPVLCISKLAAGLQVLSDGCRTRIQTVLDSTSPGQQHVTLGAATLSLEFLRRALQADQGLLSD